MASAFNPSSHPTISAFIKKGGSGKYLEEIASWPQYGAKSFADILEENLKIVRNHFINDQNFCAKFASVERDEVMPRLTEVWLAAHLIRNSISIKRMKEGTGKTPDFRLLSGPHVGGYLEIKRMNVYQDYQGDPFLRRNPLDSNQFINKIGSVLSKASKQFAPHTSGVIPPPRILAYDIGQSLDLQTMILSVDLTQNQKELTEWFQRHPELLIMSNSKSPADYVFLFAMGINDRDIFFPTEFPVK